MNLDFDSYALIIDAKEFLTPDLKDSELYFYVKKYLVDLLNDSQTEIIHFGYAPDNTADGNDELLIDGVLFRIICEDRYLGIDFDSSKEEVLKAFLYVVENFIPFWSSIIVETGFIKKEVTIELLYKDL